ncbi:hypothetical protein RE6C_02110 [Rhodopirellula europaea 6C]|uniref:Uncharacterized protein n=1 Tax=Rhodopirellula europaea 6C TaxID=1263867 RepID=M2B4L9_9BACT|nr:hypothetical protein RE6C_02110 [Rhodopirellula europaea 6C]
MQRLEKILTGHVEISRPQKAPCHVGNQGWSIEPNGDRPANAQIA